MTFSGNKIKKSILKFVRKVIEEEGFKLSESKIKFASSKNRQMVTGLIVNNKVNIPRKTKRTIRAIIYNCKTKGAYTQNKTGKPNLKFFLLGWLDYMNMIDSNYASKLKILFSNIDWSLSEEIDTDKEEIKKIILFLQTIESLIKLRGSKYSFSISTHDLLNLISKCSSKSNLSEKLIVLSRKLNEYISDFSKFYIKTKISPSFNSNQSGEIIKEFLRQKKADYSVLKIMEDIRILSNDLDRHYNPSKEKDITDILNKYGFKNYLSNYNKVWNNILQIVTDSITILIRLLIEY